MLMMLPILRLPRAYFCYPPVVLYCIFPQPKNEIKILDGLLYVKQPFFEILEGERGEVFSVEDVLESDVEYWSEAKRADLPDCSWRGA